MLYVFEKGARQETASDLTVLSEPKKAAETGPSAQFVSQAEAQSNYATQLAAIPEFAAYGPVLKSSSKPVPLTEHETEYVVSVVKHIFGEHVVFQVSLSSLLSLQETVPQP